MRQLRLNSGVDPMRTMPIATTLAMLFLCGPLWGQTPQSRAEPALACGHFTQDPLPPPKPREAASAKRRFEEINAAVRTQPYRVIFFGDSLTERFETWDAPQLWRQQRPAACSTPGSVATSPSTCAGGCTMAISTGRHRRGSSC